MFCLAAPLLVTITVAVEGLQHVIEWRLGMYGGGGAAASAAAADPLRLAAGMIKVSWIFLLGYWVSRYLVSGRDIAATLRWDPAAARLFGRVFLVSFVLGAAQVFGPTLADSVGLSPRVAQAGLLTFAVVTFPLGIALALWSVQAATGDPSTSLMRAARQMPGSILWGVGLQVAVILIPMAGHYGLSYAAIAVGGPAGMLLLAVDAVEVGFLSVVINTAYAIIAMRMAERHGAPLALQAPQAAAD